MCYRMKLHHHYLKNVYITPEGYKEVTDIMKSLITCASGGLAMNI